MATVASAVALVAAAIFLWAALEKLRDLPSTAATLRELGLGSIGGAAAPTLVVAELAVAGGLFVRPDWGVTQAGVALLACSFAVAGAIALRSGRRIRCTCFGPGGAGTLGVIQIIALLPWLGGVAFLRLAEVTRPTPSDAAAMFAAVGLAIASGRVVPVARAWREARGDRLSARETYVWLRR